MIKQITKTFQGYKVKLSNGFIAYVVNIEGVRTLQCA